MKIWKLFERIKSADLNANFTGIANGTEIHNNVIQDGQVEVEDWTAPTLLNSWANFGIDHPPAGYMKTPDGTVHLRGLIRNGSSTTAVMMTLPEGYRPVGAGSGTLFTVANASGQGHGRVDVAENGNVYQDSTNASTTWVSLSGISFKAG